jgi:hypothetical protein
MTNAFGVVLDSASLRRATIEGVSETVIAAIYFLHERSVDEIVAKLRPSELEQVIKLVGRCPSCYPPGTLAALKDRGRPPSPKPQPGEHTNPGPERLHRADEPTSRSTEGTRRWTPPSRFAGFGAKVLQSATERAANPYGITLSHVWTNWAAQHGVSETIAAALWLISRNRKSARSWLSLRRTRWSEWSLSSKAGLTTIRRGPSPPSRTADPLLR